MENNWIVLVNNKSTSYEFETWFEANTFATAVIRAIGVNSTSLMTVNNLAEKMRVETSDEKDIELGFMSDIG